MNSLLRQLLSTSISGAVLTALLLVLEPLIGKRFSKTWQYCAWLIIVLRLLLPRRQHLTHRRQLQMVMQPGQYLFSF
jgi:beta-lactamase regulating signal transducer with metallopeptidase domain